MKHERFAENPLVSPGNLKPTRDDFEIIGTFNAGAAPFDDGIVLLIRVAERPVPEPGWVLCPMLDVDSDPPQYKVRRIREDDPDLDRSDPRVFEHRGECLLSSISHLRMAWSGDGRKFKIDPEPTIMPHGAPECLGIEDPRITKISETYWVNYSAISANGISTAVMSTIDFGTFDRKGIIFPPDNKDIAIFPEKAGGRYAAFHRPGESLGSRPSMWVAFSEDLEHWGDHRFLMSPRPGGWDDTRIGCGSPPILTERGWLQIYHGANSANRYCLGTILLDRDDPSRILARCREPVVVPEADYELEGFFGNVVFACGHVEFDDGRLFVYYGAADTYVCGLETTVDEALKTLE